MKKNILIVALVIIMTNLTLSAFNGDWRGELSFGSQKLPLVFHFSKVENDDTHATLDSPLQGVKGLQTTMLFCDEDSVALEIKSIGASFSGKVSNKEIKGTFTQRGYSFPIVLMPEKSIYDRRPQTPREPFTYNTVDTIFVSGDGAVLAGTLTFPDNRASNTPMVVFVTGSGPQNRDEEMFDHRPFAVLADYLARNGVASFRYDDRGVSKSKGNFAMADIEDFKEDAKAAVRMLRGFDNIGKVGVLGHSEGGTIALMIASEGDVDFAVSLAGAIIKGKDMILAQNLRLLDQLSVSSQQKGDVITLITKVFDNVIEGKPYSEINVDEYVKTGNLNIPPIILGSIKQNLAASTGSYFRSLLSLDPSGWLENIKVPVLGINGTLDTQVASAVNLAELKKFVPEAQIREYAGLNHLFQHAITGEITEYEQIEETIAPEVLGDILRFVLSQ